MSKIVFMGTPDFAKIALEKIVDAEYNVVAVVTNPDRPKGRGMKMVASPVKEYAIEKNIPVYQPLKVKNNIEFIETLKKLEPDLIVVVAYGKILPKEILDLPNFGCINLHGSILPKYRGAAPIQWAILNGDKKTGVTTMYMNEAMDEGDIILKKEVEIGDKETTGELWDRLANIGSELLVKTIEKIYNKTAPRIKQEGEASIAPMLNKEMAKIDWNSKTSVEIKNLVRGLNPIMGAYSFLNGKKIKFWNVEVDNSFDINENIQNLKPGTVLFSNYKEGLYVKTLDGIIKILEIQADNSKKMNILDFLRGNKIEKNEIFE